MSEADGKISLHGNRNTRSACLGLAACTANGRDARTVHAEAQTAPADGGDAARLARCARWAVTAAVYGYCGDRHGAVPASARRL